MKEICENFPISENEYEKLNEKFGKLTLYISWQLYNKNTRNNHTDEPEDIAQEMKIALIRAGSYYKRQVYIEDCLSLCARFAKGKFFKEMVKELQNLWENKTRHGANRQKFGHHQEKILDKLVETLVPQELRPAKDQPLRMDSKFSVYCKSITWNAQKSMGKKITREKGLRSTMCSLSEYAYLGGE